MTRNTLYQNNFFVQKLFLLLWPLLASTDLQRPINTNEVLDKKCTFGIVWNIQSVLEYWLHLRACPKKLEYIQHRCIALISNYRSCQSKSVIGKMSLMSRVPLQFCFPQNYCFVIGVIQAKKSLYFKPVTNLRYCPVVIPTDSTCPRKKVSQHDTLRGCKAF